MSFFGNRNNTMNADGPSAQPSQQSSGSSGPWLITTLAKGLGTIAGLFSIIFGFINLFLSILSPWCIIASVLLMFEGLIISLIEAPCFCTFLDFAYTPSGFFDKRPYWVKGTLYLCFAAVPFFWCIGFSTFMSCGLIFVTSALYLMIALGKKASVDEMRIKASNLSSAPSAVLVNNEEVPKGTDPPPFTKIPITNQGPVY